jgi:deoxyribodipyrimidine photo-lyase
MLRAFPFNRSIQLAMTPEHSHFLCDDDELQERILRIDPRAYDKTRNHLDGAVTWLSPFVCHGIIDTTTLAESLIERFSPKDCYRFLYELAWREYFHRTWQRQGESIFSDLLHTQEASSDLMPDAIQHASTGINVLDQSINHLMSHGTLHNHARMWVAGITCNTAKTGWYEPARWMHYHLLDGDLASNTLSWQWAAGTFSHKQYIANQQNLNKFSGSTQTGSWLDCSYELLGELAVPEILCERSQWQRRETDLSSVLDVKAVQPISGEVAIHSIWNLDKYWERSIEQHVLFLDVEFFTQWPLSPNRWQLIRHWLPEGTVVISGTLDDLKSACSKAMPVYREYPACLGWPGRQTPRRWVYPDPPEDYQSFSQYWKRVRKHVGL